jgi:hypothetical protein
MRILGVILILFGLVLCLTIIAAPFGIFLIIVGIVLAIVGGRRKTVITNVVQVSNVVPDQRDVRGPAMTLPSTKYREVEPRVEPAIVEAKAYIAPPVEDGFDRNKWNALMKYDPEIAQVATKLEALGQHRVDEFAKAYLAINDKSYLPVIVKKIIDDARKEAS